MAQATPQRDIVNISTPTIYKPHRSWICCTRYKDRSNFQNILQELELSAVQKQIIQTRYLSILENFQRRTRNYSYLFFSGHFIITVGSLFVPALLSIQNSDKNFTFTGVSFTVQIYWATFVISLLVTIFNGVLTLFKVDKKYYFLNTTLERLRSEGWQYFSLTGRYASHNNKQPTTHGNQFLYFTHYIEKIKMKQVEEEYYKADEKVAQTPNGNNIGVTANGAQELYPPSPDQPLNTMTNNVPEPVKDAVNSLIKFQMSIEESDKNENVVVIPERSEGGAVVTVFPENKGESDGDGATDLNSIVVKN
jgi:hypothetical protein